MSEPVFRRTVGIAAAVLIAVLCLAATPRSATTQTLADRIEALDVARLDVGGTAVLYSRHPERDADTAASRARDLVSRLEDARALFSEVLGLDIPVAVVLLSPRDWPRVGSGSDFVPFASQPDGIVVLPVHPDMRPLLQRGDSARARKVYDIITAHQLGHVVSARYFHPAGFDRAHPPVRWFDELLASYFGHTYLAEREPALAEFAVDLADEVVDRLEPRFTGLADFDRYHDSFLTSPPGSATMGWYQNAFNLRAEELYEDEGLDLPARLRRELPWGRLELWTTESLLPQLDEAVPGSISWAEYMSSLSARRY